MLMFGVIPETVDASRNYPASMVFNRDTDTLTTQGCRAMCQARAHQMASRLLAKIQYVGISRIFRLISLVFPVRGITLIESRNVEFRFPAGDYYWSRLLDSNFSYEPEIEFVFQQTANFPWVFVDAGANFGFWTVRVANGEFGSHPVIAVEASSYCCGILGTNLKQLGPHCVIHRRALAERSGEEQTLFGKRHAGFSTIPSWRGANGDVVDSVMSISLDDLYREATKGDLRMPVIFKIDIEGGELAALKGAGTAALGETLFIMEDAQPGSFSAASAFALERLEMEMFAFWRGRLQRLMGLADVTRMKHERGVARFQQKGINLFLTRSDMWVKRLTALTTK